MTELCLKQFDRFSSSINLNPRLQNVDVHCLRESNHRGKHWFMDKNPHEEYYPDFSWNEISSTLRSIPTRSSLWNECDFCGIMIDDTLTECVDCVPWVKILAEVSPEDIIVVDGCLYQVDRDFRPSKHRDNVTVLWFDHSREALKSNRLVRVRAIPPEYRDVLPDNARFKLLKSSNGKFYIPFGRTLHERDVEQVLAQYDRLD